MLREPLERGELAVQLFGLQLLLALLGDVLAVGREGCLLGDTQGHLPFVHITKLLLDLLLNRRLVRSRRDRRRVGNEHRRRFLLLKRGRGIVTVGHDIGEQAPGKREKEDGHQDAERILFLLLGVRADSGVTDTEPVIVGPDEEQGGGHSEGGDGDEEGQGGVHVFLELTELPTCLLTDVNRNRLNCEGALHE